MDHRKFSAARSILAAAVSVAAFSGLASADTILFRNGDKISGQILEMQNGKIRIKSAVAGEVLVDTVDVATFSTDGVIDLQFVDGTTVKQRVEPVGDGRIAIASDAGQQEVPLGSLRTINTRAEWKGALAAGAVFNRGNSDTDAVNIWFDITRRNPQDRYFFGGQYNLGKQENEDGDKVTTVENMTALAKYDYFFNEKLYGFLSFRFDKDRIADLQYRVVPAVGLGYQWVEGPITNFFTEAGVAYLFEKYEDPEVDEPDFDDDDQNLALRAAYHFDHKFTDRLSMFHNLEIFPAFEDFGDFLLVTDLGMRAMMTQKFFVEAKVEIRHDSQPAEGADKTDQRYVLGLGWTF